MNINPADSREEILRANRLDPTKITPGQEVVIVFGDPDDPGGQLNVGFFDQFVAYDASTSILTYGRTGPLDVLGDKHITLGDDVFIADAMAYHTWIEANSIR